MRYSGAVTEVLSLRAYIGTYMYVHTNMCTWCPLLLKYKNYNLQIPSNILFTLCGTNILLFHVMNWWSCGRSELIILIICFKCLNLLSFINNYVAIFFKLHTVSTYDIYNIYVYTWEYCIHMMSTYIQRHIQCSFILAKDFDFSSPWITFIILFFLSSTYSVTSYIVA